MFSVGWDIGNKRIRRVAELVGVIVRFGNPWRDVFLGQVSLKRLTKWQVDEMAEHHFTYNS